MTVTADLRHQRTHVVFSLSQPGVDLERFLDWYRGAYAGLVNGLPGILGSRFYELSEVDPTSGRHAALPYRFLGIHDLGVDGAEEASAALDAIHGAHVESGMVDSWTTLLSFPLGEAVGAPAPDAPAVVLAFANPVEGAEREFREWYPTRHVRHALLLPSLVSGQCHLATAYQHENAVLDTEIVAVYEQNAEPEALVRDLDDIDLGLLAFPAMHPTRFVESIYTRLA